MVFIFSHLSLSPTGPPAPAAARQGRGGVRLGFDLGLLGRRGGRRIGLPRGRLGFGRGRRWGLAACVIDVPDWAFEGQLLGDTASALHIDYAFVVRRQGQTYFVVKIG